MENNPENPTTHLLDDFDYQYVQANANTRFCNLLVDRLLLYGVWTLIVRYFAYPLGMFVYSIAGTERWLDYLVSYLLAAFIHVLYYSLTELATGGKTIGKLFTRTRAVMADGQRLTPKAAFLRAITRIVPFEAFSAFGKPSYPWHDQWSKTFVIDENLTQLPPGD